MQQLYIFLVDNLNVELLKHSTYRGVGLGQTLLAIAGRVSVEPGRVREK